MHKGKAASQFVAMKGRPAVTNRRVTSGEYCQRVELRLRPEDRRTIQALADRWGLTMSEAIRRAVTEAATKTDAAGDLPARRNAD